MGMKGEYKNIRNVEDLDKAIAESGTAVERQVEDIVGRYIGLKEFYAPANILAYGVKKISSNIPFDRILLHLVRILKNRFARKYAD